MRKISFKQFRTALELLAAEKGVAKGAFHVQTFTCKQTCVLRAEICSLQLARTMAKLTPEPNRPPCSHGASSGMAGALLRACLLHKSG